MNRGSFLIKQRNKVGLTQADIAGKLGYSSQLVSLWEKDKAVPDLSIISQYASILGIDLKGFIDCKDRIKNNYSNDKRFDASKFASNLRFLRKEKELLQSDIARKTNTNIKTVGSWENGASVPSIECFKILCSIFDKTYDELYFAFVDENKDKDKSNNKKPLIAFLVATIASATLGAGLALTNNFIDKKEVYNPPTECKHEYKIEEFPATFDHDGKRIFICTKCGNTYDEIIPQLIHQYESTWSHDKKYHFHRCIDEGYEDLIIDKEEHVYSSYKEGYITYYTCDTCGYSFDTSLDVVVTDYYFGEDELFIDLNDPKHFYIDVINPLNYPLISCDYTYRFMRDDVEKEGVNIAPLDTVESFVYNRFYISGQIMKNIIIANNNKDYVDINITRLSYYNYDTSSYVHFDMDTGFKRFTIIE